MFPELSADLAPLGPHTAIHGKLGRGAAERESSPARDSEPPGFWVFDIDNSCIFGMRLLRHREVK
jgi:hypothetical protein